MAEVTPAKRVLPARERRESAAKRYSPAPPTTLTKRKSTASKLSAPATPASDERPKRKYSKRTARTPTPRDASTPPVEDILPTKVTSSKPLPVTRQKQASKLSEKDYQSIADSAILAASLYRSRMQWLSEGLFKKYWVKPVKRKGVIEQPPNNPDVKSMSKLGNGTIIIEPHKLDVTFYTVRESGPVPTPQFKHANQHTPKPPTAYPMAPPFTPSKPPTTVSPSVPPPQASSGTVAPPPQPATPVMKQENIAPPARPPPTPVGNPPTQQTVQQPAPPKSSSDPVIQMLAARAATDPQLKELMKVVATSKASPDQLKEFQKHIDEFNAVVKKQEEERVAREKQLAAQRPVQQSNTPGTGSMSPAPQQSGTTPSASPVPTTTAAAHPSVYNTTAPRPPPNYPSYPPPRMEAIIKHIVIEFHGDGASTDRFLFPDYAALDMKYGGLEMLTSFLVERKGSEIIASYGDSSVEEVAAAQAKWKPDVEYFQPVTIMVRANQHRTIETIARAARTLPEVQEHMKKVLETKTRAPVEYLVHQLPRDKGVTGSEVPSVEMVDSGVEMDSQDEDDELKAWYGNE